MADTDSETHSGELPVLQPLPPTHFVNEKTCSSQTQQEQPDLQFLILLTIKIQKTCQDFQKTLEIKTRGTAAAAKLEVTTTTKNSGRGINDHNTTRETELH